VLGYPRIEALDYLRKVMKMKKIYEVLELVNGGVLVRKMSYDRQEVVDYRSSFPTEVRRRFVLHEKTLNERGLENDSVQKS